MFGDICIIHLINDLDSIGRGSGTVYGFREKFFEGDNILDNPCSC